MFRNFFNEFKKFAMRGNVIDMAVGIIIGAAFGKIVDSLVKDIIMPPIGLLLGKVDFTNLFVVLKKGPDFAGPYVSLAQATDAGAITLNLGNFLNAVISFTIVAFAVFVLIKAINELQAKMLKQEAAEEAKKHRRPRLVRIAARKFRLRQRAVHIVRLNWASKTKVLFGGPLSEI